MKTYQENLFNNLMNLCSSSESFFFIDKIIDGQVYRVFSYRLASYTEFMLTDGLECRGHTFALNDGAVNLVCLPPFKFFNIFENPSVMDLDLKNSLLYMDKRDGSLISTVHDARMPHGFRLKSKTSFDSEQAIDAYTLLTSKNGLLNVVKSLVAKRLCVNFELTSPKNRIVLGYEKPELKILNVRDLDTGRTIFPHEMIGDEWCDAYRHIVDYHLNYGKYYTYEEILAMTGIEGYVVLFNDGRLVKIKNNWYCTLHKTKDSINNPKALFQACLFEASDDLRSLFHDDELAMKQITAMETLVRKEYNHRSAQLQKFYDENKLLSRKDYAILAQQTFKDGIFPLAMNLYLGKDMGLKDWMMKNYREFGITDVPELEASIGE